MVSLETVSSTVEELLRRASVLLPPDVEEALVAARERESDPVARTQLETILENVALARELGVPMCQDTGVHVFYLRGRIPEGVEDAVREGVARATASVPLRPNAVHPLTRVNSGDNLGQGMPIIYLHLGPTPWLEITVLPKGAGSENMSRLAMLNPGDGIEGIRRFVSGSVVEAGGKPCPPTIVGVGIGGTADGAMAMAKQALLRPLNVSNPDPALAKLEDDLARALNATGVGAMGLGGDVTVLGVRAMMAHCHTASLPVAVNLQCWAARQASARIGDDGVEYSQGGWR